MYQQDIGTPVSSTIAPPYCTVAQKDADTTILSSVSSLDSIANRKEKIIKCKYAQSLLHTASKTVQ